MKPKPNYSKFLILWSGDLISQIGGGLTSFGLGVYIFNRTGSASQMALVTLLGFLPTLILSVPAGVLADRIGSNAGIGVGRGSARVICVAGIMLMAASVILFFSRRIRNLEHGSELTVIVHNHLLTQERNTI